MKHVSYRGQHIDMELLKFQNQHQVALGNGNMNARGDILGKGGVVIKTNEQRLQEMEKEQSKPDYNPESNTASYAPQMEPLDSTFNSKKSFVEDIFTDSEPAKEPEQSESTKRAPRKKD